MEEIRLQNNNKNMNTPFFIVISLCYTMFGNLFDIPNVNVDLMNSRYFLHSKLNTAYFQ